MDTNLMIIVYFYTKKLMGIIGIDDSLTDCTQTNNLQSIMYWKLVDTGYQGGEILEITWKEGEEKYLRFSPLTKFLEKCYLVNQV